MKFACATYAAIVCCTSGWFMGNEALAATMPGSNDSAFLLAKIDSLQQELQQLRGQLEIQGNELKILQRQQQASYAELDQRITALNVPDADESINDPAVAATIPTAAVGQQAAYEQEPVDEVTSYQSAYALIQAREFDQAIAAMHKFLQDYPDSHYAANAFYWLGELYLAQGRFDQAMNQFNTVLAEYSDSNKVAAAMLKLGFVYHEKGQLNEAREQLQQVKTLFPDTNIAYLAASRLEVIARDGSA